MEEAPTFAMGNELSPCNYFSIVACALEYAHANWNSFYEYGSEQVRKIAEQNGETVTAADMKTSEEMHEKLVSAQNMTKQAAVQAFVLEAFVEGLDDIIDDDHGTILLTDEDEHAGQQVAGSEPESNQS